MSKLCFNNHNQEENALSLLHIVWILVWRKSSLFLLPVPVFDINLIFFSVLFLCGFEFEHLKSQ